MYKFLSFLILFSSLCLNAGDLILPRVADLNKNKFPNKAQWGFSAFNSAPEVGVVLNQLKQQYGIETVVETGTHMGYTTAYFASSFKRVHTIEINAETYNKAKRNLDCFPNVTCHLGGSEVILQELLPSLEGEMVLFYLDAHWQKFWPLRDELKEIAQTHRDNCIIVIDDFKVPTRKDVPYDKYGSHECSFDYVKDLLDEIFTDYSYHFLVPYNVASRAKLIVLPK